MNLKRCLVLSAAGLAVGAALSGCGGSSSSSGGGGGGGVPAVVKVNENKLVADTAGAGATYTDANLVNAWGIGLGPSDDFWVSDNGTGVSTLYAASGVPQSLVVTLPKAAGSTVAPATGQVYNSTASFSLTAGGPALFLFDNEDGLISGWNAGSGSNASMVVDRSASGAVYKGLTIGAVGATNYLYAANFNSGKVDMFDSGFSLFKSFTDSTLPAGYAPFNVEVLNGNLYVAFAKQDGAKHDEIDGAGLGFVDIFSMDGSTSSRLISQGALNGPWGMAIAPSTWGAFAGDLLVGNFGDGKINAYNALTGASVGTLENAAGTPISIDGLWALRFGNTAGSSSSLYFTAGPNSESHGLFGTLTVSP